MIKIDSIIVRADRVIGCDIECATLRVYVEGVPTPLTHGYANPAKARKAQESFAEVLKKALDKDTKV